MPPNRGLGLRDSTDPPTPAGKTAAQFDKDYYDRFYRHPETAAVEPRQYKRLARFVLSYLQYLEIPVRTVLDAGCGLGFWEAALQGFDPDIKYTGIEVSHYLCAEYGWKRASIVDFKSRRRFDLIVCQDVLAYLKDREVRTALTNIAAMCRGALYLQVITKEDWEDENCDHEKTDAAMRRRPADWYRKILARDFVNCGGGLFVPKKGDTVLWELERV